MALVGDYLYVANTDALRPLPVQARRDQDHRQAREASSTCPAAAITGRATSSPRAGRQEPLCQRSARRSQHRRATGIDARSRAAPRSCEVDPETKAYRIYACGYCATPTAWRSSRTAKQLWTVVNERDMLGSDMPPDYLTAGRFGAFYGWPWYYWGGYVDKRVKPERPDLLRIYQAPRLSRSARTPRRSASPSPTAPGSARSSRTARSSASTDRGTASRCRATRSSTCRSATRASRPRRQAGRRADRLPRRRRQGARAGRSA